MDIRTLGTGYSSAYHPIYSATPVKPSVGGVSKLPEAATPKKFDMGETLRNFLKNTLAGKQIWKRAQETRGAETVEVLSTQKNGVHLQVKGVPVRPAPGQAPTELRKFEVAFNVPSTGVTKTLDGTTCVLPERVAPETNVEEQTLPKLLRASYQAMGEAFLPYLETVQKLTADLQAAKIQSALSYVKPDLKYGGAASALGGFYVLQVGQEDPKLVLNKIGDQVRITLHQAGETRKFTEQIFEHPEVRQAFETLVKEANFQANGDPEKGLKLG